MAEKETTVLVGIDIGTSGAKAILMKENGEILASHHTEYRIHSPQPGWAEQNPEVWVQNVGACVKTVTAGYRKKVTALSFSGQMHGITPVGADGVPVRNAILWADSRSVKEVDEIPELIGHDHFLQTTKNRIATGYGLASLLWLSRNEPGTIEKTSAIFCPKDYVRYRLGGHALQEISDASGTCCLNVEKREWAWDIFDRLGLSRTILPPLAESTEHAGSLNQFGAGLCDLPAGIPLYCGGADNAAAGIGAGLIDDSRIGINIGTGGQVGTVTAHPLFDSHYRTSTFCHPIKNKWNIYGATLAAGLAMKWFRETFCPDRSFAELDEMASHVPPGARGLLFLPYLAGERTPWLDPNARGVFFGLSLNHGLAEMYRAVMEGVTYALAQSGQILTEMGIHPQSILFTGGGSRSPLWSQMMADVFGLPTRAITAGDACIGAAIIAGAGSGIYADIAEGATAATKESGTTFKPDSARHAVYLENCKRFRDLYLAGKNLFSTE